MSSEDFKSLIVTDPDLVDEGIDVSGLRTTTDTSPFLLGNIPDYSGIQYSTLAPTKYTDLMRLYSQGLPTIDTSQPATPPSGGGGGGSGDGGQATNFDPVSTPIDTGGGITNVDTPLTQMITDPVTGQTQTVRQAMTSDDAYRGISPVDNTIQMENLSPIDIGTLDDYDDLNDYNRALDAANTSRTIDRAPDIFDINQTGDPALNPGSKMVQGDDPYGTVTEEDIADNTSLLQKLGLPADFDLKQAAIEAGINLVAGVPIT